MALPDEPTWVDGDPARIEQIVSNVLANAIKYTERGGRIALTLEVRGKQAVIRVRDNGVGIDAKLLGSIFEPFTQADTAKSRSQGGLGIGLALVRTLAELHGGSVEAHSDGPGKGAEFLVRLPLAPGAPVEPRAAEVDRPSAAPVKILVVDDNHDTADTLADILRDWGHDVRGVYSGASGIETSVSWRPDLILLDLGMPVMDGYEVARRMRERPELDGTRIVAFTGYEDEDARDRVRAGGFDGHLIKPVGARALAAVISERKRMAPSARGQHHS